MSLVSEALRKARREAEEQGIPAGVRPRPRIFIGGSGLVDSRLGTGLVLGAVIAFAAALVGGVVAWWAIDGRRGDMPPHSTMSVAAAGSTSVADPGVVATPLADPGDRVGGSGDAQTAPSEGVDAANDGRVGSGEGKPAAPEAAGAEAMDGEVEPPPRRDMPAVQPDHPREFVAEADLGDVSLTLGYLVYRPTDAFAQINGVDVYVGSIIEGFVIDEITKDKVVLHDDDGPVVIRVR